MGIAVVRDQYIDCAAESRLKDFKPEFCTSMDLRLATLVALSIGSARSTVWARHAWRKLAFYFCLENASLFLCERNIIALPCSFWISGLDPMIGSVVFFGEEGCWVDRTGSRS